MWNLKLYVAKGFTKQSKMMVAFVKGKLFNEYKIKFQFCMIRKFWKSV